MATYRFMLEVDTTDSRPGSMIHAGKSVAKALHYGIGPDLCRLYDIEGLRLAYDPVFDDGNAPAGHVTELDPAEPRAFVFPHACPKCHADSFAWGSAGLAGELACTSCGTVVARIKAPTSG